MRRLLPALILLLSHLPGSAETGIGSLRVRGEELVVARTSGGIRLLFTRTGEAVVLDEQAWEEFRVLWQRARRAVERLRPGEADYLGRAGILHVAVTSEERGAHRGPRIVLYLVAEGGAHSNIHLDGRGQREFQALVELAEESLRSPAGESPDSVPGS